MSLPFQRSRAGSSFLVASATVVLIAVALLAGTAGFLAGSTLQAMRDTLAQAPATEAALQVSSAYDPATAPAQDAGTRAVVGDAFAGAPVTVWRSLRTAPVPVQPLAADGTPSGDPSADDDTPEVVLQADDRSDAGIATVAGAWPTAPGEAALEQRAAEALGLAAGDRILVGPESGRREFVISAIWRADDPTAARWFGDPAIASGRTGDAVGPLLVAETDLAGVFAAVTARWVVQPDAASLTPSAWSVVEGASADGALSELLARADVFGAQSVTVEGDLHAETARVTQAASAARAVTLVPAVLVATLAIIALLQLATLLAGSRSADTRLLRARGASVGRLTLWAAVETGVVAVPAALLGAAAGAVAGWSIAGGVGDLGATLLDALVLGVATAAAAVLVSTGRGALAAWAAARGEGSSRTAGAPVLIAAAVTAAVAALAAWQLVAAGTPLLAGPSAAGSSAGAGAVNPVAVLAPGLALLALALFAVAGVPPITRVLGAGAARGRSLTRLLAVRTLTRRASLFTVAVLVTALAAGGAVFAASVTGSLDRADERTSALVTGADVRAAYSVPANVDLDGPRVTSLEASDAPGATDAATALSTIATLGTDEVGLVALPAATLPGLLPGTQLAGSSAALEAGDDGMPGIAALPAGSQTLSVAVTVAGTDSAPLTDTDGTVTVAAWLADSGGAVWQLSLGEIDTTTATTGAVFTRALPPSSSEVALLGLDVARVGSAESSRSTVVLDAVSVSAADGEALPAEIAQAGDEPLSVALTRQTPRGRILAPDAGRRVPVVFTTALASRLGVGTGDELSLTPSTGRAVDVVVAATVDAVPGSGRELVVFADTATLQQGILAAGGAVPLPAEVWVATSDPRGTAAAISTSSPLAVTVTTRANASASAIVLPAVVAVQVGVGGGVVIALVCLIAVVAALLAARRAESGVLAALGSTRRDDVAERRTEASAVVAYGLVAGVVAGAAVAVLLAAVFARAAVPGAAAAGSVLAIDPAFAAAALAALGVGCAAVVTVYGSLVRRSR
ncbi:hypothetical protein [Herbiconiux daphne]|uniref:FtsX-like permease family protein n=1 Tax=Herbiconiux daphne TaxID=2970914 RepID=A0ABT2H1U0_9MICO|nr:hypothetical protein [Herbiconiux daphne]MCS5733911.1 hypothetical protein [Herbiconiux daphne]